MRARSRLACVAAAAFVTVHGAAFLRAADLTWDADPVTSGIQDAGGNWNTTEPNWFDGASNVVWNNATPDSAFFGSSTGAFNNATPAYNVTVTSPITAQNINLGIGSTGGYYNIFDDFGAGALTLAGNVEKSGENGTGQFLLGNGLTLTSGQHTFTLRDTPGDKPELTINAAVTGAGGVTVNNNAYDQWGTLLFTTANGYTGGTNLVKGRLVVTSNGALGSGAVNISDAGVLSFYGAGTDFAGDITVSNPVTISRSVYTGAGFDNYKAAIISANAGSAGSVMTFNGPFTVDSTDARVQANTSTVLITSDIQQGPNVTAGVLTVDGDFAGFVTLTGNNTALLGGVRMMGGVELNVSNENNLGGPTAPITFTGGTFHPVGGFLSNFGAHVINTGSFTGGFDVDAGQSFTVDKDLTAGGSLGKRGAGTLNLPMTYNLTGGQTFFDSGTVNFTGTGTSNFHSIHLRSSVVNISSGTITTTNNYSSFGQDSTGTNGGPDQATVNISGTGALILGNADLNISDNANTAGTINLSGNGILRTTGGLTWLGKGANAAGTINQSGGSIIVDRTGNFAFVLGDGRFNQGPRGYYSISGGTFTSAGEVYVGEGNNTGVAGTGTWSQSGGTVTINNWFVVGREGGAGTVDLSGGTMTHNGGNMSLGDSGSVRPSMITVRNNFFLNNVAGEMWIGNGGTGNTTSMFVSGTPTINTNNWFVVGRGGATGTLDISGGTITRGGTLTGNHSYVGEGSGSGTVNVHGTGAIIINTGQYWVANGGSSKGYLSVSDSGQFTVTNNWLAVGRNGTAAGTINLSGGTLTQTGTTTALTLGSGSTATGILNQTGGTLNAQTTFLGESGNGTMNLSGGTASLGSLSVALNSNAHSGVLNVSGTAAVSASTMRVNPNNTASGTVSVTGGTLVSGTTINFGTISVSGTGAATLGAVSGGGSLLLGSSGIVRATSVVQGNVLLTGTSTLTILQNGTSTGTSKITNLSIASPAVVDLNDNDLVVGSGTTKAQVEAYVASARNGGAWTGSGITSTSARNLSTTGLGVLSGAEYTSVGGTGTFSGQTYGAGDTLVKYTWNGDANLDGRVTFDDYVKIDTGFNTHLTGWLNGDFNYSGGVTFDDYVLIDIAFNQQSGTLGRAVDWISGDDRSAAGLSGDAIETTLGHLDQFGSAYGAAFLAAVPEPTSLVALGVPALAGIVLRRSRRVARRK